MKRKTLKVKGFTLVELIVVMIILAILAALLVPSMTGYIEKASESAAIVETRGVVEAAQAYASEVYALGSVKVNVEYGGSMHTIYLTRSTAGANSAKFYNTTVTTGGQPRTCETMKALAEVEGTINSIKINDRGQISELVYTAKNNVKIKFTREDGYVKV